MMRIADKPAATPRSLAAIALLLAACGGRPARPERAEPETPAAEPEAPTSAGDEQVQVEGLLGTIPREAVEMAMSARLQRFGRCFFQRSAEIEVLGGRMTLAFRIDRQGGVRWVYPKESTVGDRETERCVLEVARKSRFRRPTGGEAEATWSFEMEADEQVRPPVTLHASQFEALAVEHASALRSACGDGPFEVTVYVAPGGELLAVGAAAPGPEEAERLECVVEQVESWQGWPDPGSYVGKGSFRVP